MHHLSIKKKLAGFSLLEIIIMISILSLFFITIIGSAVFYLRNAKSNENKILAARYAQETLEWVRGEKETDWQDFVTTRVALSGMSVNNVCDININSDGRGCWCIDYTVNWPESTGVCTTDYTSEKFKRQLILTNPDSTNTQVNVQITVSWMEGDQTRSTVLNTIMSFNN